MSGVSELSEQRDSLALLHNDPGLDNMSLLKDCIMEGVSRVRTQAHVSVESINTVDAPQVHVSDGNIDPLADDAPQTYVMDDNLNFDPDDVSQAHVGEYSIDSDDTPQEHFSGAVIFSSTPVLAIGITEASPNEQGVLPAFRPSGVSDALEAGPSTPRSQGPLPAGEVYSFDAMEIKPWSEMSSSVPFPYSSTSTSIPEVEVQAETGTSSSSSTGSNTSSSSSPLPPPLSSHSLMESFKEDELVSVKVSKWFIYGRAVMEEQ